LYKRGKKKEKKEGKKVVKKAKKKRKVKGVCKSQTVAKQWFGLVVFRV
jgi:RNA polymerase subunit RPABC4/transcription elongation factor Spt4